jgi:hypothetical protein
MAQFVQGDTFLLQLARQQQLMDDAVVLGWRSLSLASKTAGSLLTKKDLALLDNLLEEMHSGRKEAWLPLDINKIYPDF